MKHPAARTATLLSTALLGIGALASCSAVGGDGETAGSSSQTTDGSSQSTAGSAPSASESESAAASATASASPTSSLAPTTDLGEPVATRPGTAQGQDVTLDVYPVRRSGSTSTINLTMTVSPAAGQTVSLYGLFGDDDDSTGDAESARTVDGIKLVDGANGKVYLVATDGAGNCLCTNNFFGTAAKPGEIVALTATFAAPPSDVGQVDVIVPQFGTVTGVPVE